MKKLASMFSGTPAFSMPTVDLQAIIDDFKTLDPNNPGAWPLIPRIVVLAGIFIVTVTLAALLGWQSQYEDLDAKRVEEVRLREDWVAKKHQAVNLDAYRNQLVEIERAFGALLKQLPNAAEMESLLVDVNQAGLGRGLQFELFKPGTEAVHDFYAELPITISMTGSFHDFGAFAGDVAKLPRIFTLNDIHLTHGKQGDSLSFLTIAKTFRYLDENEIAERKRQSKPQGVPQ